MRVQINAATGQITVWYSLAPFMLSHSIGVDRRVALIKRLIALGYRYQSVTAWGIWTHPGVCIA